MQILFGFTIFFLLLAIFVNWLRHTVILSRLKRIGVVFKKYGIVDNISAALSKFPFFFVRSSDVLSKQFHDHHDEYERHFSYHFQGMLSSMIITYDIQFVKLLVDMKQD